MNKEDFLKEKNIVEIIQILEKKGVYKEITICRVRKNDGSVSRIPIYGCIETGDLLYYQEK